MSVDSAKPPGPAQPLAPALAAMTALQAVVAMALFAPGVLAPPLGLGETDIALFATGCFAVGMAGALAGGALVGRLGSFGLAAICMAAVIAAMSLAAGGHVAALIAAGLVLGLAFGPETPASSALLSRIAQPRQRSMVFSIRQTGNQIGAIIGSVTLPLIALAEPRLGYVLVMALAACAAAAFLALRPRYDPLTRDGGAPAAPRAAWALLRDDLAIRRLAAVSAPFSALQLGLNAFLVTYLVGTLELPHVTAGLILGVAQAGGLVGRLGWGYVAGRLGSARSVIAALGFAMGASAAAMAIMPTGPAPAFAALVAFLFGLTASGWNGVFLAEVARCAPAGRVAEATGAVLTASYGGLLLGPAAISLLAAMAGLRVAYAVLGAACILAAIAMAGRR